MTDAVGVAVKVVVDVTEVVVDGVVLGVNVIVEATNGAWAAPRHSLLPPIAGQFEIELVDDIEKAENAQAVPHIPGSVVPCCQNLAKT